LRLTSFRERIFIASAEKLTIRVSTKGQVILPKSIRRRRWDAGTRLVVEDTAEGVLLKAAPIFESTRPEDVFGSLDAAGPPKTLEEMDAGVMAEARRCHWATG
jgi:AbrB family looped-hinge helix DNA binding protein